MKTQKNHLLADTSILFGRLMKHVIRNLDTIITVCITPIAMMLLFVYIFGGAMGGGMSKSEYVTHSLPGVLLIAVASGIGYVAIRLFTDVKAGFFERFQSMPISASSALWAHVLTSLVSNAFSLTIVIFTAFLMGFRSSAGVLNWLLVIGILLVFILALTWIAVITSLKAKSAEGSYAFSYPLVFLPFISSAFVPTDTMSPFVRAFAERQPVTAIVDSIRALLMNQPVGNEIWVALAWCIGVMIVSWFFAMRAYRKNA